MNRKIVFAILVLFAAGTEGYCLNWSIPPSFDIVSVSFSSSVTVKKDNGATLVTDPEWTWSGAGSKNDPFAYIKSSSPTVIAEFYCLVGEQDFTNLTIYPHQTYGAWTLGSSVVTFDSASETGSFSTSTFYSSVGKRMSAWTWKITHKDGQALDQHQTIGSTQHNHYTLLNNPQAPFINAEYVWTDLLDYSCQWANGHTTASSCVSALTSSLYNSGVVYDGSPHYASDYSINLGNILGDLDASPSGVEMECRDFANFINMLNASIGITSECLKITLTPNYYTNHVNSAGTTVWAPMLFPFHMVSLYDNQYVIDASLRIDNDADPTQNETPFLAKGDISKENYVDKFTEFSVQYGPATASDFSN